MVVCQTLRVFPLCFVVYLPATRWGWCVFDARKCLGDSHATEWFFLASLCDDAVRMYVVHCIFPESPGFKIIATLVNGEVT